MTFLGLILGFLVPQAIDRQRGLQFHESSDGLSGRSPTTKKTHLYGFRQESDRKVFLIQVSKGNPF